MATAGSGRRKRLAMHLEAALAEVERLADAYRSGIERLEGSFLRVVDLGVQLRRGEIRHRTARQFVHPCMHTTGTKGAIHSGLSIDDANGVYQALEHSPGVSESRLESYFMRIDALDNDLVGVLDIRLNKCLTSLLTMKSTDYYALEVTGSDPHQELFVKRANGVEEIRRTCFRPSTCTCAEDSEPWRDFVIVAEPEASRPTSTSYPLTKQQDLLSASGATPFISAASITTSVQSGTTSLEDEDVRLSELKRQFGFEPLLASDGEDSSTELLKRRRMTETGSQNASTSSAASATRRLTPMQIYARKVQICPCCFGISTAGTNNNPSNPFHQCREKGVEPKKKLRNLFVVTNGALNLNLSQIGFHSPENLQELLDVVTSADLPIASLDVTNNFFNTQSFQIFCELLRLPNLVRHAQKLVLRCVALPQRSDFPTILRILSSSESGGLTQLRELDLSYNTFSEDSVLCLDSLLTGLKRLEKLSLESCFTKAPDPEVVEVAVVKDLVRTALAACCNQLKRLNFGSNWMSFPLLNSLFAPESALQELSITQMTFFCFETAGFDPTMWDFNFQHLESLTLSETKQSRSDYLPVFLDVLTQNFSGGFIQLKHLDLTVKTSWQSNQDQQVALSLDTRVIDLLQQIGAYGGLQTLRIQMESPINEVAVPNYERVLADVLTGGLPVCEALDLSLGVPLSLRVLRMLIGSMQLPKIQKLKLSIVALDDSVPSCFDGADDIDPLQFSFANAFRLALGSVQEFMLEVKVRESKRAKILSDQLVHEISEAWRNLDNHATDAATGTQGKVTREVAMTKRKIRRTRNSGPSPSPEHAVATFVFVFSIRSSSSE